MDKNFNLTPFKKRRDKPYGHEIILTPNDLGRTGKIIFLRKGTKNSLQYHDQKEETICLYSGKALLWVENNQGTIEKVPMELQSGYVIKPFQKHRYEAVENSVIFEVSESERGTTFRLEDDYKRENETDENRK